VIKKNIKELGKKTLTAFFNKRYYNEYLSFSQAGEDKVVEFLFKSMGVSHISYLEIGTNNPIHYNNTYLFYLKGDRGICIEPNPTLIPAIKKSRPQDVCLNVGIAKAKSDGLDFYIFDKSDEAKGLSTFSKEEVLHIESTTHIKVAKIQKIPVVPINEVLKKYFSKKAPDFVSLDVEGLDLEVLQSFDFDKYRPTAICVETVSFSMSHKKIKSIHIIDFMTSKGYFVYADTGINSVFVNKELFQ
jgi:FkbM family methyltransferase